VRRLLAVALVLAAAVGAGDASGTQSAAPALVGDATSATATKLAFASWCGSPATGDRVPNVVAGNPVHWVYVLPSDGPDRLSTVASVMQSDAEQVDGWWRGQDPTRTPRNDLAAFSCGNQLDITTVRSSRSGASLESLQVRFLALVDTMRQAGLTSPATKYLAYYDGPAPDGNVCGQGGGDAPGFGVAVVYYQSCSGVSTAVVAAHEFLHTLGAVATGAPHDCTGDSMGHTCDNTHDLMYPSAGGDPLAAKILDPGRDDYYGHSGSWIDTQDSPWLLRTDAQTPLTVNVSGPGSVSADVPGLLCETACVTTWNTGQRLVLTATPRAGERLVRWTGACTGSATCDVAVTPGKSVSAFFAPASFPLTVAVAGKGTVRSATSGIACRPRCSASLRSYTPVRLTATPARGWRFRAWSGGCTGRKAMCTLPMKAATSARATFARA
jgi:Divergent InlB B-repeat domain